MKKTDRRFHVAMTDTPLGPRTSEFARNDVEEARRRGWLFLVSPTDAAQIIRNDPRKTIGGRPGSAGYVNVYKDAKSAACADWLVSHGMGGLKGLGSMKPVWKLVPKSVGVLNKRTGRFVLAEVGRIVAHPPGKAPEGSPIRKDWHTLEVQTAHGTRWYGFADARITSGLRMAVLLGPGQERDEVIAKWEDE